MESINNIGVKLFKSCNEKFSRISPEGITPLTAAANHGHTDICGILLTHGSNVNEVDKIFYRVAQKNVSYGRFSTSLREAVNATSSICLLVVLC